MPTPTPSCGGSEPVGFAEHAVYRDDDGLVQHAELLWPGGGGIMLGTARAGDDVHQPPGTAAAYLVADDPEAVVAAAVGAGGHLVRAVVEQDYGGKDGTVRDPEGNLWSFGSYQPA